MILQFTGPAGKSGCPDGLPESVLLISVICVEGVQPHVEQMAMVMREATGEVKIKML